MKFILFSLIVLCTSLIHANNDRAIYIKKYANETKTALVIGNSNYNNTSLSKLKNPINDARAVRDKLKEKNFNVLYLEDGTQREIDKIVRRFKSKLNDSGVGLFYFAGHGLEVDKKNYLVPIGANVSDEDEVKYDSIAVNEIVDRMKNSNTRLNIVILDACRNNPFKRGSGGLAPMSNAKGTLIAYATDSGSTASDNVNEKNGLFTKHFLKALDDPLNQRDFFYKVRKSVHDESNGRQTPYLNDGTLGDFFFTTLDTKKQKSKISFNNITPSKFSLTINTIPSNAKVKITNIKPKYYDGIKLLKGNYNIKVSKSGYIIKEGTIELNGDLSLDIVLEKEIMISKIKKKDIDSFNEMNHPKKRINIKEEKKFKATTSLPKMIRLSWSDSFPTNISYYYIYSSESVSGQYNKIAKVPFNHTQFDDIIPEDGKIYFYKITAYDKDDSIVELNNIYPINGSSLIKPNVPQITLSRVEGTDIVLNWIPSDVRTTSYNIFRVAKESWFTSNTILIPNVTGSKFIDDNVVSGVEYEYKLQAIDKHGLISELTDGITLIIPKK